MAQTPCPRGVRPRVDTLTSGPSVRFPASFHRFSMSTTKSKSHSTVSRPRAVKKSVKTTKASSPKYVYYFGDGKADGDGKMKALLGGKGANLAEMTRIGLPVPPGFTVTTEVCTSFYQHNRTYPPQLKNEVASALAKVEKSVGQKI